MKIGEPRAELRSLDELPEILTVPETAEALRIGRNAAYAAVARGELPAIRIGRRVLVPRAQLQQLLAGRGRYAETETSPLSAGSSVHALSRGLAAQSRKVEPR
jgi:excisionase family DNA binding protein